MHLWFINHYAASPDLPGGTRHFELATELLKKGHRVSIFASSFSYTVKKALRKVPFLGWKREEINGVEMVWIYSLPYRRNNILRFLNILTFSLVLLIAGILHPKPQILLASSPHPLAPLVGWILAKIKKCPFVLELRDLWPEDLEKMGEVKPLLLKGISSLMQFLYHKAARIITLTREIRDGVIKRKIHPQKLAVIPNGILLSGLASLPSREETRSKLGWEGSFTVLYTGSLALLYGVNLILDAAEALQKVPGLQFVVVGDGETREALEHAASKKQLKNIHFQGGIPKKKVLELISAADVALSLQRPMKGRGALPNKIFDYMAGRCPIISNIGGESQEVIAQAQCGVTIPSGDPAALAVAITMMREKKDEARKAGENGYTFVQEHFSREKLALRLEQYLQEMLTLPGKSRNAG